MNETTSLESWAEGLPRSTLVVHDPGTVRPIREIVDLMSEATPWRTATISGGGHMAPLTRPELVNPLVAGFLGPGGVDATPSPNARRAPRIGGRRR